MGRDRDGALRAVRLAGEFQARRRRHRAALYRQQLALSRSAAGVAAGDHLVGAVLCRGDRLAVAATRAGARAAAERCYLTAMPAASWRTTVLGSVMPDSF